MKAGDPAGESLPVAPPGGGEVTGAVNAPPSASTRPPPRSAFILAFAAIYLIWGSTYLGMRVAVETMPPFLMTGLRFIFAGGGLLGILWLRGAAWPTARQWRINATVAVFLLVGGNGVVAWATQFIPSGITALLLGVSPLFIVLTEWAWPGGSRPAAATMLALLLGFSGVAWLAAPWERPVDGGLAPAGVLAILAACTSWGIGAIYSRHARHGADPFAAAATQMLAGGVILTLLAVPLGDFARLDVAAISANSWIAFVYLTAVGSLVGFSTFVWLMKHSTPARVSTYAYVNPVVAVFLGWLLLNEPITPRTLVASAIIITAVIMITVQSNRSPRSA